MDLNEAFRSSEQSIIHRLGELQAGVNDSTGKGLATEAALKDLPADVEECVRVGLRIWRRRQLRAWMIAREVLKRLRLPT